VVRSERPLSEAGTGDSRVAVVSDGSALPRGADVSAMLRADAALIGDLGGIPAFSQVILADSPDGLAAGVRGLPADVGSVLLAHVEVERAYHVTHELQSHGVRPTVSEHDVNAVVLAAVALRSMAFDGRSPQRCTMVLAGARELPMLSAILVASGVADITTWNSSDAVVFPLHTVLHGADMVIDLVNETSAAADYRRAGIAVISREDVHVVPYVSAGLLRAAAGTAGLKLDTEVLAACARALAPALPSNRPVARGQGLRLARLIADIAAGVHLNRLRR